MNNDIYDDMNYCLLIVVYVVVVVVVVVVIHILSRLVCLVSIYPSPIMDQRKQKSKIGERERKHK